MASFQAKFEATDAAGTVVGSFEQRGLRRGGRLRWRDRVHELRPASSWRERYALVAEDRELALPDAKGWGKRPDRSSALVPGPSRTSTVRTGRERRLLRKLLADVRARTDSSCCAAEAGSSRPRPTLLRQKPHRQGRSR